MDCIAMYVIGPYIFKKQKMASWDRNKLRKELAEYEMEQNDIETFIKLLDVKLDWNSVTADDLPDVCNKLAATFEMDSDKLLLPASILELASKIRHVKDVPWFTGDFCGGCETTLYVKCGAYLPKNLTIPWCTCFEESDGSFTWEVTGYFGGWNWNVYGFETLFIPHTVSSIDFDSLFGVGALKKVVVDKRNETYSSDDLGMVYSENGTVLEFIPPATKQVYINENVQKIAYSLITSRRPCKCDYDDCGEEEMMPWCVQWESFKVDERNQWLKNDENGNVCNNDGKVLMFLPYAEEKPLEYKLE